MMEHPSLQNVASTKDHIDQIIFDEMSCTPSLEPGKFECMKKCLIHMLSAASEIEGSFFMPTIVIVH